MTNQVNDIEVDGEWSITHPGDSTLVFENLGTNHTVVLNEEGDISGISTGINSIATVSLSEGQSGIESAISNASPGDYLFLEEGTWDIARLTVDKEINFRGLGNVVFRYPDSDLGAADIDAGDDHLINFTSTANNSSIKGFEIDGNASNQDTGSFDADNRPFAHGIKVGGDGNNPVSGVTIENCYIHDTIRSCISGKMWNCRVNNCVLENSWYDHHLYAAGSYGSTFTNIRATGHWQRASLVFGTSSKQVRDTLVDGYYLNDVEANPDGDEPTPSVIIRDDYDSGQATNPIDDIDIGCQRITLKNINIDTSNVTSFGASVVINSSGVEFENLTVVTDLHDNILEINAEDTIIDGYTVHVPTATPNNQRAAIDVAASNCQLSDVRLTETSTNQRLRGLLFNSSQTDITIDGYYVDIGRGWINTSADVENLYINNFNLVASSGPNLGGRLRWYQDGEPQEMDLSQYTVGTDTENGETYKHDGSNSITADGGSTSAPGLYVASHTDSEWKTVVAY